MRHAFVIDVAVVRGFLVQLTKLLPTEESIFAQMGPAAERVTCKYCSSTFLLAPGENTCPNCGAPAQ